mmetsp:Transcript_6258/g.14462  ORF Transcript_6258/g.14462 Transcript_6258/m.14462 type:complete len:259 (-) Transcript_6258:1103-1879(-)
MGLVYSDSAAVASHWSFRAGLAPAAPFRCAFFFFITTGSGSSSPPPSSRSSRLRFLLRYSSLLSDSGWVPLVWRLDELDFLTAAAAAAAWALPPPSLLAPRDRTLVDRVPAWKLCVLLFRPRLDDRPDEGRRSPLSRLRSLPPPFVDSTTDTFFSVGFFLTSPRLFERDLASGDLAVVPRRPFDAARAAVPVVPGVTDLLLLPPPPFSAASPDDLSLLRLLDMDLDLSTVSVFGTPVDVYSTPDIEPRRPADRLLGGS